MPCYRNGGCGPYEMYSCSECPASKKSYLDRDETKTGAFDLVAAIARRVVEKQTLVYDIPVASAVVDADTVLADLLTSEDVETSGIAQRLIQIHADSTDKASVEELFAELVGTTWMQYLKLSEAALDQTIALAKNEGDETNATSTTSPNAIDPVTIQKINQNRGIPMPLRDLVTWTHWRYGFTDERQEWVEREIHSSLNAVPAEAEEIWPTQSPAFPPNVRDKIKMDRGFAIAENQLATWPHWRYGYYENGGDRWRTYDVHTGLSDVPECAEEIYPIKAPES